jgi:hypothetical protein
MEVDGFFPGLDDFLASRRAGATSTGTDGPRLASNATDHAGIQKSK